MKHSALPINLASEPFRRDRPLWVASLAVGLILLLLLIGQIAIVVMERNRARDARNELAQLNAQLDAQRLEQQRYDAVLRRNDTGEVLDRSVFLNTLIQRKAISWTRLFGDLEKVMPGAVRLISIRPQVSPANQVILDMVVGAQASEPVIELLMKLEASPVFGATSVASWLPPSQTDPLFRYRITVNYTQIWP
jgi:type IV pilus assembly protein PilN